MIVKTKRGYYVYSTVTSIGRRRRLAGPFTTYSQATKINNAAGKKRGKKQKSKKRK
jgi:hypothetical protein